MTIAVHISTSRQEDLSDNFNFVCVSELAVSQPEDHFIFIFDSTPNPEIYLEPNCTPVILLPSLKNDLLSHYWHNYKLPAVIRKYNVDIFITSGPTCSLKLGILQCLIIQRKDMLLLSKSIYLKRFGQRFLKKARHIFTPDHKTYAELKKRYEVSDKLTMLYPGLKQITEGPLSEEQKESLKNSFTDGLEFFHYPVCTSDFEEIKKVLKAFSIFKKWQKSSFRMVLQVRAADHETTKQKLGLYKYRDDITLIVEDQDAVKLQGAAYAILIAGDDTFIHALRSLKSDVPVIISDENKMPGALHIPWQEEKIAEMMMMLYKDEHMRKQTVMNAREAASVYSWKKSATILGQTLKELFNS